MERNRTSVLAAVVIALLLGSAPAAVADYVLDPTFGVNGIAITDFGAGFTATPADIVVQADGRILSTGYTQGGVSFEKYIAMTRHFADGAIDSSFSADGWFMTQFVYRDQANGIALQDDGKIVAVGQRAVSGAGSAKASSIYRFHADGAVDTSFADGGQIGVRYPGESGGEFVGVNVLATGKIWAAGSSWANANGGANGFGCMRFTPDGDLDTSFGTVGQVRINYPVTFAQGSCAFTSDGKLLWANNYNTGLGPNYYTMARVDSLGAIDFSFGGGSGVVLNTSAVSWGSVRCAVQNDGKILLAGTTTRPAGGYQFIVFRYHADGTIDPAFGTSGRVDVAFTTSNQLYDIAVGADDKILLVGSASPGGGGLARLNPDGSPDETFAPGGTRTLTVFGFSEQLNCAQILPDGRILGVMGRPASNWALVRFVNDAPQVTTQPAGQVVCEAEPVVLSVSATGLPALAFQWRKDGVEIGGATDETLEIAAVSLDGAGSYDVIVSNAAGADTSDAAVLEVLAALVIEAQPAPVTACIAGSAVFSVTATGASPAYQWRKDAIDIPGATNASLVLDPLSASDTGSYDVVASGPCGMLASDPAALLVESCRDTIFVDASADSGGDGESWVTALNDLQTGLLAAVAATDVREIWVAAGTYTRPGTRGESFNLASKVALYGGFTGGETSRDARDPAANPTILSGDRAGDDGPGFVNYAENNLHVVVGSAADSTGVLDGFVIEHGNANVGGPGAVGGGLTVFGAGRPRIIGCVFRENSANAQGGAFATGSNTGPLFESCTFVANRCVSAAGGGGAGVLSGAGFAVFRDCVFDGNTAAGGGGLFANGANPTVIRCSFKNNLATGVGGGAMHAANASTPVLSDCEFEGNAATAATGTPGGGAVLSEGTGSLTITNSRFFGNRSSQAAGGIGGAISTAGAAAATLTNCLFSGNVAASSGGALHLSSSGAAAVTNCTLSGDLAGVSGGGILLSSNAGAVTLTNSVLWGNVAGTATDESAQIAISGSTAPVVSFTNVQGLTGALGGTGNIGLDPLFVDADGADAAAGTPDDSLTVQPLSPVIDAGSNAAVPGGTITDLAGQPRFFDDLCVTDAGAGTAPIVDMGAFEAAHTCATNVGGPGDTAPAALHIGKPFPNPMSGPVRVALRLPVAQRVVARVIDVSGRSVATIVDAQLSAGDHIVEWGGSDASGRAAADGVYFMRIDAGDRTATHKLVRIR